MIGSDRNSTTATKGGERTDDERPAHVVVAWVAPHVREGVEPPANAAALGDGGGVDGLVLHGARRFRHWRRREARNETAVENTEERRWKTQRKVLENARKGGEKHMERQWIPQRKGSETQRKGG